MLLLGYLHTLIYALAALLVVVLVLRPAYRLFLPDQVLPELGEMVAYAALMLLLLPISCAFVAALCVGVLLVLYSTGRRIAPDLTRQAVEAFPVGTDTRLIVLLVGVLFFALFFWNMHKFITGVGASSNID